MKKFDKKKLVKASLLLLGYLSGVAISSTAAIVCIKVAYNVYFGGI